MKYAILFIVAIAMAACAPGERPTPEEAHAWLHVADEAKHLIRDDHDSNHLIRDDK
jgi:hypothetical protein